MASYLNQPTPKSQIGSLGVEQVIALVLPDEDQLKEYLDSAPKGIDPRLWKQAIQDNPDPTKLIPVPIVGFNEVGFLTFCAVTFSQIHFQISIAPITNHTAQVAHQVPGERNGNAHAVSAEGPAGCGRAEATPFEHRGQDHGASAQVCRPRASRAADHCEARVLAQSRRCAVAGRGDAAQ